MGGLLAFPVDAETITEVTLTPEQTLALFGQSLNCTYRTSTGTAACTFTYFRTIDADNTWTYAYNDNVPAYMRDYIRSTNFIEYRCLKSDVPNSNQSTAAYINAPFSVNIQNVQLVHAPVLCSGDQRSPGMDSPFAYPQNVSLISTFSASPVVNDFFHASNSQYTYGRMAQIYRPLQPEKYCISEIIANSQSTGTPFNVSGIEINFNFYPITRSYAESTWEGYVLLLGCPTLTEDYVTPDITTAPVDYSPILSDMNIKLDYINIDIEETNSRLYDIQQKLNAIYEKMVENGLPNPTLTPASTIPRDLQQYYSGIASGAPSASAINDFAGGAEIIPFSSILSASGLGGLFGVLVAVACAGWVLTRGRGG